MTENFQNKRWYDLDPTLSLAVRLLENASGDVRLKCADYIIEEAKNRGAKLEYENRESFNYLWKRWQDSDEKMFEAMEYFKIIDSDTKKQLSLEIIEIVNKYRDKLR